VYSGKSSTAIAAWAECRSSTQQTSPASTQINTANGRVRRYTKGQQVADESTTAAGSGRTLSVLSAALTTSAIVAATANKTSTNRRMRGLIGPLYL